MATEESSGPAAAAVPLAEQNFVAGESGGGTAAALSWNTAQVGLWALLATLSMLFAGFTSAYLVRRVGSDWQPVYLPPILWFNTALLLLSSFTLENARTSMRRWRRKALKGWLLATTLLGLAFLLGQIFAWQQLVNRGIYIPTSPHSSFFYMLTGVYGLHLLGGLCALLYALSRTWSARWSLAAPNALNLCTTYWHFVDGLWVYLFFLMFLW